MPRGKFLNHKGKSRQFTPVEELQREQELGDENLKLNTENNNNIKGIGYYWHHGQNNGNDQIINIKKMAGAVDGLIEISNPNRTIYKSSASTDSLNEHPTFEKRHQERHSKDKQRRANINQKTPSEMKADIERLALVRKKREAAAELRLAAKKENSGQAMVAPAMTPTTPIKSDMSLKKKGQKHKSNGPGFNNFLKADYDTDDIRKLIKARNGNKRNGMLNV